MRGYIIHQKFEVHKSQDMDYVKSTRLKDLLRIHDPIGTPLAVYNA